MDQNKPIESIHRHRFEKGEFLFIVRRTGARFFTLNTYDEVSHAKRALDEYCEGNECKDLQDFINAKRQEVIDKKEEKKKEAAERRTRKRAAVEAMAETCRRSARIAAHSRPAKMAKMAPTSPVALTSNFAPVSTEGSTLAKNAQILSATSSSELAGPSTPNPPAPITMGQLFGEASNKQGYIPTIYLLGVDPKKPRSDAVVFTDEKENHLTMQQKD